MWLFDFRTEKPARGGKFFDRIRWRWPVRFGDLTRDTVDCGKVKIEGEPYGPNGYRPRFYEELGSEQARQTGYEHPYIVGELHGYRSVSMQEIREKNYHRLIHVGPSNLQNVLRDWIPQMELREIPEKFVDRRTSASLSKRSQVAEPEPVKLRIIFQQDDLATDDPELDIEEPLEEALREGAAGMWSGSGTEPGGLFVIDIETTRKLLPKTLRVVRRVLKKLHCPPFTVIQEDGAPAKEYPLDPEPVQKQNKPTHRKRM
ncbi:MAG: hypothetical protein QOE70_3716 [Chthoniobacter sp.]|jgi:hypothetical protein|nr:hypothetical protein [Chthoniobacter sp.]